jgi:hypothetical protein
MKLLLAHPELKNVVFIIGDRDFNDLFKYLRKIKLNTYIFGFRKNLSSHFFNLFSTDNIFYINDHWNEIISSPLDDEFPPLTPINNKFSEQRHINFRKCNSEIQKFKLAPEREQTSSIKKKKKKKKSKNGNAAPRKEEEKKVTKTSACKDGQASHSSTEDSHISCNGRLPLG